MEVIGDRVSLCVCVCVIVVQVHVGNSQTDVMLLIGMHQSALYCYFISLSFGGRKTRKEFIETMFFAEKED